MKKGLLLMMAVTMIMAMAACAAPAAQEERSSSGDATQASEVVTFADTVLEAKVRAAMGIPEGDITASEAEAVTEMYFGIEWQANVSEETQITDLGGLEYFKNLKSLNLSSNAVTDISPLTGLTKLTSLILAGNPVDDISPLAGMTSLEKLSLSGCAAQDYSLLAGLNSLELLILDDSAITDLSALSYLTGLTYLSLKATQVSDVSPLAGLNSLTQLYLAECPVDDYSPLADIYTNLEEKDFTVPSSLKELGFTRPDNNVLASYSAEGLTVTINHSAWGIPEMDMEADTIRLYLDMDDGYRLTVGYDPGNQNYVFNISQNGEKLTDYVYVTSEDSLMFGGDREAVENAIRTMLGDTDSDDILLAPIPVFNDTIKETFGITANALYALPFEPPSLKSLGFVPDGANAAYTYQEHEPHDMHISIYRPEWGESSDGRNIEFYDDNVNGYSLLILYFSDDGKYCISLFLNGADCAFDYLPATDEYGGEYPDQDTVKRMFNGAFGTQGEDFYGKPIVYFEQLLQERFGMSMEELYALPLGT